jgi:hypothetical protein
VSERNARAEFDGPNTAVELHGRSGMIVTFQEDSADYMPVLSITPATPFR